jgi:hypothetical protein
MTKQALPPCVQGLAELLRFDFQGAPRMITTRQGIALRPRRPTLTLLTPRQLFDPAVQFFDLPAHVACVLRPLRRHGLSSVMGKDPVTVAVWGDQLA